MYFTHNHSWIIIKLIDYSNIGNINEDEIKKQDERKKIFLIISFVLAVVVVLFLINSSGERSKYVTEQEKTKILDELVKNSDSDKYSEQEKIDILKKISNIDKEGSDMTMEEKFNVLDSLIP